MSYRKQQDKIRLIADLVAELDSGNRLKNLAKGAKGEWLVDEYHDPNTLSISKFYQRQFSVSALNSYEQFDREVARPITIAIRPQYLGGHKLVIDGQHTAALAIYSADIPEVKCLALHHPEHRSLEECIEVEAKLFFAYNTARKNPTPIDIFRAGLCWDDPTAVQFNDILESCNLKIEELGDVPNGDEFVTKTASRFIRCVEQFADTHRAYIPKAVNFIRRHWGQQTDFKYRDDFIHGITTLLVFLDEGRDRKGARLNGKKEVFKKWMETEMPKSSVNKYVHNTGGGNSHYKIVHRIVEEYNFWSEAVTISTDYLHMNGIWDETMLETRKQRLGKVGNGIYLTAKFPEYDD